MDITSSSSPTPRWTLADFLSSYAFWALFVASLLVSTVGQGTLTMIPMMARDFSASYDSINFVYVGATLGAVIGTFLSFIVAPRQGRSALVWPLVACAATALVLLPIPSLMSSPLMLILFGVTFGAAQTVLPLTLAILIFGGRPDRIDFASALALLSATAIIASFSVVLTSMLYSVGGTAAVMISVVVGMIISALFIVPARDLGFDGTPRPRHRPITPHQRSPLAVTAILLAPLALAILTFMAIPSVDPSAFETGNIPVFANNYMPYVISLAIIVAFVYLGYWLYRIHGELAGAARSQRLLTPLAAIPIGLFVPLGLPVMVMTLGDLLNDRAKEKGEPAPLSVAWLAIWSLIVPPIGIAMIQSAANRSYAMNAAIPSDDLSAAGKPA